MPGPGCGVDVAISRSSKLYAVLRVARNHSIRVAKRLKHVHPTAYIHPSCHVSRDLSTEEYVFLGNECWIGPMTHIGRYALFGPRVAIVGDDHVIDAVGIPMHFSGRPEQQSTHIGRDVWVGYGTIIRRGTRIGDGAIIGAGSVVTGDIPPYEIWVGSPAQKLRDRFTADASALHANMLAGPVIPATFATPQSHRH